MADKNGWLAAIDHIDESAGLEIFCDETGPLNLPPARPAAEPISADPQCVVSILDAP